MRRKRGRSRYGARSQPQWPEYPAPEYPRWLDALPEKIRWRVICVYILPAELWPDPQPLRDPVILVVSAAGLALWGYFATLMLSPALHPKIQRGLNSGLPVPWIYRIVEGLMYVLCAAPCAVWLAGSLQRLVKARAGRHAELRE